MDFRIQKRPMLTFTEHQPCFALAAERPDRTAAKASKAQVRLLDHLPPVARRSIAYDNGSGFFDHVIVTAAAGMAIPTVRLPVASAPTHQAIPRICVRKPPDTWGRNDNYLHRHGGELLQFQIESSPK
jgi:hypothetical protein